jgi:hypothetical protein
MPLAATVLLTAARRRVPALWMTTTIHFEDADTEGIGVEVIAWIIPLPGGQRGAPHP